MANLIFVCIRKSNKNRRGTCFNTQLVDYLDNSYLLYGSALGLVEEQNMDEDLEIVGSLRVAMQYLFLTIALDFLWLVLNTKLMTRYAADENFRCTIRKKCIRSAFAESRISIIDARCTGTIYRLT